MWVSKVADTIIITLCANYSTSYRICTEHCTMYSASYTCASCTMSITKVVIINAVKYGILDEIGYILKHIKLVLLLIIQIEIIFFNVIECLLSSLFGFRFNDKKMTTMEELNWNFFFSVDLSKAHTPIWCSFSVFFFLRNLYIFFYPKNM